MPFSLNFTHIKNKPLAEVTTLGIGGPAKYFAVCRSIEEMVLMLREAKKADLPVLILGKGSNVLFEDSGFEGLVIQNKIEHLHREGEIWRVGAGFSFSRLGLITAKEGLSGLEFAGAIPATVGGAIYMNAGAGSGETAAALTEVLYLGEEGERHHYTKDLLNFSYRSSCFQGKKGAIVEGSFRLQKNPQAALLQKEMIAYRKKTQPLTLKSAGCAFRNPPGHVAGRLIEECGLKGVREGGVSVSTLHANFIVNDGGGSAEDVKALMERIQEVVYQQKGIFLEGEIRYIPGHV